MSDAFDVVRHPRARGFRLALNPTTGRARLVVPKRAALGPALAWAHGKREWLGAVRAMLPEPRPFADGVVVPVADEELVIRWAPGQSRIVQAAGGALLLSGPPETVGRRVEAWLKRRALDVLTRETVEIARLANVDVTRVSVGDPTGRWGSCASTGAIRYSWRLILAPGWVRRATVAHEVAHRIHMNHGADFHRLVADLLGSDPKPARAWLHGHGAALHWFGRSSP